MKLLIFSLLCILLARTRARPQITKLFPVQEFVEFHQQTIGKLRATYDFVFRKPENTSDVGRILAEAELQNLESTLIPTEETTPINATTEDWWSLKPEESLDPLAQPYEPDDVELVDPQTGLRLPNVIYQCLVEWFGSFLGLTYMAYAELAKIVKS